MNIEDVEFVKRQTGFSEFVCKQAVAAHKDRPGAALHHARVYADMKAKGQTGAMPCCGEIVK